MRSRSPRPPIFRMADHPAADGGSSHGCRGLVDLPRIEADLGHAGTSSEGLRAGPDDLAALFRWPYRLAQDLKSAYPEAFGRLLSLRNLRVTLRTYYSGLDTVVVGLTFLRQALGFSQSEQFFRSTHACDISPVARKVFLRY